MPIGRGDLKESLEAYAEKMRPLVAHCGNEQQTRTTLIEPYLELLGYDARDPLQVRSEYIADIGQGRETVDYAILRDDRAWLLIEAKSATRTLDGPLPAQLARYAWAADAAFMLYTNGVIYRWYEKPSSGRTAVSSPPFLTHNALEPGDRELDWLRRVHPEHPEHGELARIAGEIAREEHLFNSFEAWFEKAKGDPPDNFLRLLLDRAGLPDTESHLKSARRVWVRMMGQTGRETSSRLVERPRGAAAEIEPPLAVRPDTLSVNPATQDGRRYRFAGRTLKPTRTENPRRTGSHGHRSYAILLAHPQGIRFEQYREKGGRQNDLRWDYERGRVEVIPPLEPI